MTDFKVGDVVTFVMTDFAGWQGGKGVVRSVGAGYMKGWDYKVEILEVPPTNSAQRIGNKVDCSAAMLKLVKPEPKLEFKKGDIVESIGFQYKAFQGKTLIVDAVDEGAKYPYKVRALREDYQPHHAFKADELVAGEPLAEWEIELLDHRSPKPVKLDLHPVRQKFATGGYTPRNKLYAYADWDAKLSTAVVTGYSKGGVVAKPEAVDHPAHYGGDTTYEVIKVAEAWGFHENAYLFNALKYLGRAGKKGSKVEDLKKLVSYVEREIALEEAK